MRTPKSYRFDRITIALLEELKKQLPDTETEIVSLAIYGLASRRLLPGRLEAVIKEIS